MLDFSAKLYPRILDLAVTLDLKVIFIILIITSNLHDLVGLVAVPNPIALDASLAARSYHKSMIIK